MDIYGNRICKPIEARRRVQKELNEYICKDVSNIICEYASNSDVYECLECDKCVYIKSGNICHDSFSEIKVKYCLDCLMDYLQENGSLKLNEFKKSPSNTIFECLCCGVNKEKKEFGRNPNLIYLNFCNCRQDSIYRTHNGYVIYDFRCENCKNRKGSPYARESNNCECNYCDAQYGFNLHICKDCYKIICYQNSLNI